MNAPDGQHPTDSNRNRVPVGGLRVIALETDPAGDTVSSTSGAENASFDAAHRDAVMSQHVTIDQAFAAIASERDDHPVMTTARGSHSFGWLLKAALRVQRLILDHTGGAHTGDGRRIGILMGNDPAFLAAFYGTFLSGEVAVPLPPDASDDRLKHVLSACDIDIVLTSSGVAKRRAAVLGEASATLNLDGDVEAEDISTETLLTDPDALAMILYTSGSVGDPKGVMLTHRNILANTQYVWKHLPITPDDRALCMSPTYHAFGHGVLQSHLLSGATMVIDGSSMFPATIMEAARKHGATTIAAVPDVWRFMLSRGVLDSPAPASLTYATTAGARIRPEDAIAIADRLAPARFLSLYGQTESTSRICALACEDFQSRSGSIGRGCEDILVEVVDEHGAPIAPGEVGEVRAKADNIMRGYWNDPEGTARVLRDGYLYTGDLATVDDDGFIYLRGRADHLVKIGAHRFSLEEVEQYVLEHLPVDAAVAVTFEAKSDGLRLAVFVRPHEGDTSLTDRDVMTACGRDLPRHMLPRVAAVVDEFPLTSTMKVDRAALTRRAAALADESATIGSTPGTPETPGTPGTPGTPDPRN